MGIDKHKRTALVTGSGRNIGRAIAKEQVKSGFNIILNGSSDRAACESVACEIESFRCKAVGSDGIASEGIAAERAAPEVLIAMGDVGVREEAIKIAELGIDRFGSIDVLVNNAAIRPSFDLLNDDEDVFRQIMNTNFYAGWWLTRACLPGMISKGWGRVVNFTGMNAQQGYSGKSAVSISKHAAWGLTKSIAKEYGKFGITANIISPGTIEDDAQVELSEKFEPLQQQNPTGRLGKPADIAKMVAYLTRDDAGFVNGQLLQINGGVVV